MQTLPFYFYAILIVISTASCQQASQVTPAPAAPVFDEAAETAAIWQVIENETKCFFDGDYDCWVQNWSHEAYAMQAWNNSDGTADAAVGWDKINAQGKGWIEEYYQNGDNVIHPVVVREKAQVKFFNERTAYLIWLQYNANQNKTAYRPSQETRLMEKTDDGWKIVNVTAFWDVAPEIPFDSLRIGQ